MLADTLVIPYNDLDALERVLADGRRRRFIVEPVMENIGICLPDAGYLDGVRELTRRYGTLLIFDEVKTGITAGWSGATGHFGVQPDLVTLAKSIGGGLPIGAFGGEARVHGRDRPRPGAPPRHVQRQPAGDGGGQGGAARHLHARRRPQATIDRNERLLAADRPASSPTPACRPTPCSSAPRAASRTPTERVRNYRDYKATDFDLAFASWIWGINRGILLPPGLDEQWLISVAHTDADVDHAARCSPTSWRAVTA